MTDDTTMPHAASVTSGLPPEELGRIVTRAFDGVIDREKMDAVIAREERDKARLRAAVSQLEDAEGNDDAE